MQAQTFSNLEGHIAKRRHYKETPQRILANYNTVTQITNFITYSILKCSIIKFSEMLHNLPLLDNHSIHQYIIGSEKVALNHLV